MAADLVPAIRWCEASVRPPSTRTRRATSLVVAAVAGLRARACRLPRAFYAAEVALLVVACGSVLFHYTQSWRYEVADELPMSLLAVAYLYTISDLHWLTRGKFRRPVFVASGLCTLAGWCVYLRARDFDVFHALFTAQVALPALVSCHAASDLGCPRSSWLAFLLLIALGKGLWNVERHLWATGACPASYWSPTSPLHAAWPLAAHAASRSTTGGSTSPRPRVVDAAPPAKKRASAANLLAVV
ncbi:N-acylsphingosine amidohydrolase [Aureococcus anophagefferens]|nr:N-acylsphingosine amidohydrolase [Aureococcus anophagefferens]